LSDPTHAELLSNLNEYTNGIWKDDPRAIEKMKTFLVKDVYTDPKFQEEPKKAEI
jgi:hypothetical protein